MPCEWLAGASSSKAHSVTRHEIETVVIVIFEVDAQADLPIELPERDIFPVLMCATAASCGDCAWRR